jgi:ankyrin repeat protein
MFDVLLDAMIETDYHFAGDKDFFWRIGVVSLETAQKILAITGFDDGASVFSAVENKNFALTDYLLNNGVSPNKPFKFSTGGVITALQEAASCKNTELVKRLLEAGAVETVKNI